MKKIHGNGLLYVLIVILPVILFGSYFFNGIIKQEKDGRKNQALWVGSIHQKSWDQFISETLTSLNILSISVNTSLNSPEKIQPLLKQIQNRDPRYGELFLLNRNGKVLTESDPLSLTPDFSQMDYILEAIRLNDTVISNHPKTGKNGQKIIDLAVPVSDENHTLKGLFVAQLRIDYIANLMKVLTPDSEVVISNGTNTVITNASELHPTLENNEWVKVPIDHLP